MASIEGRSSPPGLLSRTLTQSLRGGLTTTTSSLGQTTRRLPTINDRLRERQKRLHADTEILTGHSYKLARLRQRLLLYTYPVGLVRLMLVSLIGAGFLFYSAAANISEAHGMPPKQVTGALVLILVAVLFWRHMEVHTLRVIRKTRIVHLGRWNAFRLWVVKTESHEFKLEHLERMNVQELVGETQDGCIFRICFHLEGGRRLYGLQTDRRVVALEQARRLRRFINTLLLLRKHDKPESWLVRKIRTLQRIQLDGNGDLIPPPSSSSMASTLRRMPSRQPTAAGGDLRNTSSLHLDDSKLKDVE